MNRQNSPPNKSLEADGMSREGSLPVTWPRPNRSIDTDAQRRSAASPLHSPPVAGHLQRYAAELECMRWLMTYYQRYRMRLDTPTPSPGDAGREPAFANLASVDLELVDYRVLDGRVLLVE